MKARLGAIFTDSIVYGLSGVVARFISVFLIPIYTRLFTPADYGILSLVGSSLAIVSIFVGLGLDSSAHRWFWETTEEADRKRTISTWTWSQFLVASAFGLVVFLAGDAAGRAIVGRPDAGIYFKIGAATLPLGVLGSVASNWFRMQRRPWATTSYTLATTLLTLGMTVVLVVLLRTGLIGVYVAQVIGLAIGSIVAAALLRDWISPALLNLGRLREMLRYSLPLIPGGLAYWVVSFVDRYFVQAYRTTSEVGLYSVGSSLAAGVALVTAAFQQAWGPFALSIHTEADARHTYATVFLYYLWVTSALCAGLDLFAPEILRLLTTARYAGAATVVGILAMSYVMVGLTYIAATGPAIVKRTGPTGIAMVVAAFLTIALNFALVPKFGKEGSAIATLVAQTVTPVYLFHRAQRLYPIPYRFRAGAALVLLTLLLMAAGTRLPAMPEWMLIVVKLAMLFVFVPAFFILELATVSQVRETLRGAFGRVTRRGWARAA